MSMQVWRLVCARHRRAGGCSKRNDHSQHAGAGQEAPAAARQPSALALWEMKHMYLGNWESLAPLPITPS